MTAPLATRPLGPRGLQVTTIGLGCAPLGNLFSTVADDTAAATVDAAWDGGVRLFDTAPLYGLGLAERRLGAALRHRPRDEYVVSTKVGRLLRSDPGADPGIFRVPAGTVADFDYSRDAVLRSIEASLDRLGLDRLDVVHVHDPDDQESDALDSAFPTLLELRDQGVIRAVGCGMNQAAMLERFVARVDLDCVLLAGRWTLLDRSGAALLDTCATRGVGVLVGGAFNSGALVDATDPHYDYAPASSAIVDRVATLRAICDRHGVPLPAAALAFAGSHPAASSVVVGARSPDEVRADLAWAAIALPDALRNELADHAA
jgi:D-threo-aldose 1-dehydrogenase